MRLTPVARGLLTDEPFAAPEAMRTFRDRFELDPLAPQNGVVFAGVGAHGFDVGVREHAGWEGYFAVTHDLYPAGSVFHADVVAFPAVSSGAGIGEAVFAVQTGSTKITSDVNFVAVNSYTSDGTVKWQVSYSAAKYQDARRTALAQVDHPPASLVPDHPVGITRAHRRLPDAARLSRRHPGPRRHATSRCAWSHRSSPTWRSRPRTPRTCRGSPTSG